MNTQKKNINLFVKILLRDNLPSKYLIDSYLSEGWSSLTYSGCLASNTNQKIVFKILKDEIIGQDYQSIRKYLVEAMVKESMALKVLNDNPYTPRLYDFLWIEDRPCIVMEKFEGVMLEDWVQGFEFNWNVIRELTLKLTLILKHIHSENFIHCDINPRNILVNDTEIYLIDFGAVQFLDSLPYWSYPLGRHTYMSPEQLEARKHSKFSSLSFSSDLHQLGCLIYYMLTQKEVFRRPLKDEDYQTTYLDRLSEFMACPIEEKISKIELENISPRIVAMLKGCLQADLSKRYKDINQFSKVLRDL